MVPLHDTRLLPHTGAMSLPRLNQCLCSTCPRAMATRLVSLASDASRSYHEDDISHLSPSYPMLNSFLSLSYSAAKSIPLARE